MNRRLSLLFSFAALLASLVIPAPLAALELTPGIYREYAINTRIGDQWRVTDPGTMRLDAQKFLPNPVFTIAGVNLNNAVRAELTLHHWAGHSETRGQQIIVNGEHRLDVPVNPGLQTENPAAHHNCDNPVLDVPLAWLQEGGNTFQGTIAEEFQNKQPWGWGQWGWYWIKLRIYFDEADLSVPNASVEVNAPHGVIDGTTVSLSLQSDQLNDITEVQYYAKYVGFDDDGDAVFYDWHGFDAEIDRSTQNVGRSLFAPFAVNWDLSWIPDQPGPISFIAVIKKSGTENAYRVTEPVGGYFLRRDYSVKLIRPHRWPSEEIRDHRTAQATLDFPPNEYPLAEISYARIAIRTWNGANDEQRSTPFSINDGEYLFGIVQGASYYYGYDNKPIPPDDLTRGALWRFGRLGLTFTSSTEEHGAEILTPGPCLLLRWDYPIPDYLSTRTPESDGWYVGNMGWVYYTVNQAPWMWSVELDWCYVFDISKKAGWSYSAALGYIWTDRSSFPWIYLLDRLQWFRWVETSSANYVLWDPVLNQNLTIPRL